MRLIVIFLLLVLSAGCAKFPGQSNSYSAFGDEALNVARVVADRLSEVYPPARTTLYIAAQEGGIDEFNSLLGECCMHLGFTVVHDPQHGAVRVLYLLDMIQGSNPLRAYVYVETDKLKLARSFNPVNFTLAANYTEQAEMDE